MGNVSHTPGPWEAEPDGARDWKVRSEEWGTIVNRNCYPDAKVDTTVEADARLIAAAPELLAALHMIVNDAEPGEDARLTTSGYNAACAAIAKATGNA